MAMRRPRIKASANLMPSKRKPKLQTNNSSPTLLENETKNSDIEALTAEGHASVIEKADEIVKSFTDDQVVTSKIATAEDAKTEENSTESLTEPENVLLDDDEKEKYEENGADKRTLEEQLATKLNKTDPILSQNKENNHQPNITIDQKVEDKSFKCPTNISFNRSNSNQATSGLNNVSGIGTNDDIFQSDQEEGNVLQMDMQKSSNTTLNACPLSPMSPSKTISRQRIRPMPIFGQRRNSFVGSSPSPHTGDDGAPDFPAPMLHRRERHYSASLSQTSNASSTHVVHYHTPHKYVPLMHTGRIRTESGCSAFSDTYAASSKSRKTEDHHQHHRTLSRRDFEARFSKGVVPDKSTLKMFDLIYYNPATNPMEQKPNVLNMKQDTTPADDAKKCEENKPAETKTKTDAPTSSMPVPQLKLNANGELILDDKSLVIETTAEQEARKALANSTLIFLDENTGMNGFYRKQKRTKEWRADETIKFYRCLQTVGTDFSLMCQLFPKRTRRDLKLKFKKEERINLTLINKAILYPKTFNIDELKLQLEAEEQERAEAEQRWKELKARECNIKKKNRCKNYSKISSGARALANGDEVYQNENVTKEKLKERRSKKNSIKNVAKKRCKNVSVSKDNGDVVGTITEENIKPHDLGIPPAKKKRIRLSKKLKILKDQQKKQIKIENICIFECGDNFTDENVKEENQQQANTYEATAEYETSQLEMELDDLLLNNQEAAEKNANDYSPNNATDENLQYILEAPIEVAYNQNGIECKSLVNMDDGTVTLVNDPSDLTTSYHMPNDCDLTQMEEHQQEEHQKQEYEEIEEVELEPQDLNESPKYNNSDMDESDIQQILTELSEGSMVLVSTLDPNNPDKLLNEIYMLDKVTGELCDKPLDIPDTIVQCILSVMS